MSTDSKWPRHSCKLDANLLVRDGSLGPPVKTYGQGGEVKRVEESDHRVLSELRPQTLRMCEFRILASRAPLAPDQSPAADERGKGMTSETTETQAQPQMKSSDGNNDLALAGKQLGASVFFGISSIAIITVNKAVLTTFQ